MDFNDIRQDLTRWQTLSRERRIQTAKAFTLDILRAAAAQDQMSLYTDFSLWAYFRQRHQLKGTWSRSLYQLRRLLQSGIPGHDEDPDELRFLDEIIPLMVSLLDGQQVGNPPQLGEPEEVSQPSTKIKDERWLITGKQEEIFTAESESRSNDIRCVLPKYDELLGQPVSSLLGSIVPFPFYIHVFDVERDEDGVYHPAFYTLIPDYLVDVTAVASCFVQNEFEVWSYFVGKLLPRLPTYHLMLGNMVNTMLDRMMTRPEDGLQDLIHKLFQDHTVQISQMDDDEVRKLTNDLQKHYKNLASVVSKGFVQVGIDVQNFSLEPSFISNKYGLQGRLDLLFTGAEVSIVELKSGKPFRPNSYGLKIDHYIQTLLYDLLLKSTGISYQSRNFILYSSQSEDTLRYAPPVKKLQMEAIHGRNKIVLLDMILAHPDIRIRHRLFQYFSQYDWSGSSSFLKRDADKILQVIRSSSAEEWKYYLEMLAFIQNEMIAAKLGDDTTMQRPGHARLWLEGTETKDADFAILSHLQLTDIEKKESDTLIYLQSTENTNPLANFRQGDIVVLYPKRFSQDNPLRHELIKGSIIDWSGQQLTIRPRSEQLDLAFLKKHSYWNVEHDMMDSSFRTMFENLFTFLLQAPDRKQLWLGQRWPELSLSPTKMALSTDLTMGQAELVQKAYAAKDYYMIWGPPGTGKTSRIMRELVRLYCERTDHKIYLLSYTNRAVDEMTEVICELGKEYEERTIRFGSRYGTRKEFQGLLYRKQVSELENRNQLRDFFNNKKIFLSTLASFWRMRQVVNDRSHSILIVDEASQILEPSIIGLIGYFQKVILIGDHKQLPAVSVQRDDQAKIDDQSLVNLGFVNRKEALFQRLLRQAKQAGQSHAFGMLHEQGRMHKDIMNWVNHIFYEGQLALLPGLTELEEGSGARKWYVETKAEPFKVMSKNNSDEADHIILFLKEWMEKEGRDMNELHNHEIGIITPFRAQIALLRNRLYETWGESSRKLSVDTVERYQGGARDVILISACVNHPRQLEAIQSLSSEGVDRKFNVAITRARQQVVLFGSEEILRQAEAYRKYIDDSQRWRPKDFKVEG